METFLDQIEKSGVKTYDTALPHAWCLAVVEKTGKWPYGFIWSYDDASIFGKPVAITDEAKKMEKDFNVSSL